MASEQCMAEATVGLALLPKKLPRVLTPELRDLASAARLRLVALDPHRPLEQQQQQQREGGERPPPSSPCSRGSAATATATAAFDCILHKLHVDPVWEAHLARYVSRHPHVRLLDPLAAVRATEDRALMLTVIPPGEGGLKVRLPAQGAAPHVVQPPPPLLPGHSHDKNARAAGAGAGAGAALSCGITASDAPAVGGSGGASSGGGGAGGNRKFAGRLVTVRAPAQVVVGSRAELRALAATDGGPLERPKDVRPPLIIKTQRADAAGGSGHGLAVALSWCQVVERAEALQSAAAAVNGGSGAAGGSASWVPLVVQEYVPHREALYKVYVLGRQVRVERRASLTLSQLSAWGAAEEAAAEAAAGPQPSAQVEPAPPRRLLLQHLSAQPLSLQQQQQQQSLASAREAGAVGAVEGQSDALLVAAQGTAAGTGTDGAVDHAALAAVALELSRRMGLTMFNFDVVVPEPTVHEQQRRPAAPPAHGAPPSSAPRPLPSQLIAGDTVNDCSQLLLYVVDVNYFPGYDKLPGWEALLVAHLRATVDSQDSPPA